MPVDLIRYDILAQQALRGLVRNVLADAAKKGLPGDHHFYITFDTTAEGVRLSPRLLEQYPEEMTVVLQHQFWDLKVGAEAFEVGLSFGGVPERLLVPFDAITGFRDPSVQFALQFETLEAAPGSIGDQPSGGSRNERTADRSKSRPRTPTRQSNARAALPASRQAKPDTPSVEDSGAPDEKPSELPADKLGAEVVRLDRFRKK
jgi:hypothetical protein